jgi:hypothetical protein
MFGSFSLSSPPSLINKLSLFLSLPVYRRAYRRERWGGGGEGMGKEPSHTTARKLGPLLSINLALSGPTPNLLQLMRPLARLLAQIGVLLSFGRGEGLGAVIFIEKRAGKGELYACFWLDLLSCELLANLAAGWQGPVFHLPMPSVWRQHCL